MQKILKLVFSFAIAFSVTFSDLTGVLLTQPKETESQINLCSTTHEDYSSDLVNSSLLGIYSKYAVAVDSSYCATVGKNIFEKNGSVVDVAIAVGLCNGIMNMQSMGIGGGHFMNIYIKSKNKSYFINARETAPLNAYKEMFFKNSVKSQLGGLATGIPGELKGYAEAHRRFGYLPWRVLVQPAIDLCENGFKVLKPFANNLESNMELIRANKMLASILINPETNKTYKVNETIKLPALAKTFRVISLFGVNSFYNGSLAVSIVNEINANGGNVTLKDLNDYKVNVEENQVIINLDHNLKMFAPPPPSSSILVAFVYRLMRGFRELKSERNMTKNQINVFHQRFVESIKHAFAIRSSLGDAKFVNVTNIIASIKNESYIDSIRMKIDDKKTFPSSYYSEVPPKNDHGTAHISIIGPNGDAVSLTSTVNAYFGAKYAGEQTGIVYNNQMDDFSTPDQTNYFNLKPSDTNYIQPGKRPMSSMSPIIIINDKNEAKLVLGASGGTKIISSVSLVALKTLLLNNDLKTAIDTRRVHHQLYPEYLEIENDFSEIIENYLTSVGHSIKCFKFGGSIVQGVHQIHSQLLQAYADPRKGGATAGV